MTQLAKFFHKFNDVSEMEKKKTVSTFAKVKDLLKVFLSKTFSFKLK